MRLIVQYLFEMCTSLKILIARVLSKNPFVCNYPGLRFETIDLKKHRQYSENKTIVCLGDSNTFGWNHRYLNSYPALLENSLKKTSKSFSVINCGVGGNTVIDGFNRLESDVILFKPDVAIISFGFNDGLLFRIAINKNNKKKLDLAYKINDDYCGTPVSMNEFEFHIKNIIFKLQKNNIKIILMGLYKIKALKSFLSYEGYKKIVDLQNEVYLGYNDMIKNLAFKNDVVFFDLWNKLYNYEKINFEKNTDYLQADGFHLNTKGYEVVVKGLSKMVCGIF
ncbi:MAG: SGNH/GDSL hydrolase family protein [Actinomycetota bacterium]|nr:SGNH/GDSL hydrolase family protein [Actinomycetota bacterium]